MKIAIVRGAFLNQYEGQLYYPLAKRHQIVAYSSLRPIHSKLPFPVVKLPSPMDLNFGPFNKFKMPILNRIFIDAHWLIGLENELRGFDIAHCADIFYHFTHQCLSAKRSKNVKKVVATIFENIPFNNEGIWGRKSYKQDAISNIDHFIAISERSKEALILEGCSPDKITVIGQRIDTHKFLPKPRTNNQNNTNLTILFCGRLEYYKGVFDLIYSAKRLLSDKELKNYNLRFLMIGDGSQKVKLFQLVKRLNIEANVTFATLPYNKMPEMYQHADIFVAPSRATQTYQEQFSTVLLEAQASGMPIVTTYSGGIPENVEDSALMANPGDFYSISNSIKKFIVSPDLRLKFGKRAREHVKKYDILIGAKQVESIYYSLFSNEKQ